MYITIVFQIPKENICFLSKNYLATYFCQMQTKIRLDISHHTFMRVLDKIQYV